MVGKIEGEMSEAGFWDDQERAKARVVALKDAKQLRTYCEAVLGNPIRFAARLFQWSAGRGIHLEAELELASREVGEFLQLANITRDLEKDLNRGVAYHPALAPQASAAAITRMGRRRFPPASKL